MGQLLFPRLPLVVVILLFPALAIAVLGRTRIEARRRWAVPLFAAVNIALTFCLFVVASWRNALPGRAWIYLTGPGAYFLAYVGIALVEYGLLRRAIKGQRGARVASYVFPLVALVGIRFVLDWWDPFWSFAHLFSMVGSAGMFLGISYLAFRVIRLTVEVHNGAVPMPTMAEYLSFVFFCPTMSVGPITTYSVFRRSLHTPDYSITPPGNAALRICKGLAKYLFLGSLFDQISYAGLMLDGHQHGYGDLAIAAFAYYMFLFCNFSGYCDIVIGASGLAGIQVQENFRDPLTARNLQDFWNRWHMTLSFFMRDLVYTPMSKWFIRRWGARRTKEALVIPTVTVFLLIGLWHGPTVNYIAFGLTQGVGLVAVVYFADAMRTRMGNARYKAYLANPWYRWVAIGVTAAYMSASLAFFANTHDELRRIIDALH